MQSQHEMIRQLFSVNPRLEYLPREDHYLAKRKDTVLSFNVIGVGVNGQEHIRNTLFEQRADINGIFDVNASSIEAARREYRQLTGGRELKVYESLEAACFDSEVDALVISTPNYTHIDVIRIAAKSGKHILLEKPMATTIEDAKEIMDISRGYPAIFQIGLQYRYKAMYTEALYEVQHRRSVGDLKSISIAEHRLPFLDKVGQWNKFSAFSGGTLVEKCCHYFDLFNLFAGSRAKKVYASGSAAVNYKDFSKDGKRSDIIDNAVVVIEYENGIIANFNLCMFSPMFREQVVLCGSEGRIEAYESQDFLEGKLTSDTMMNIHTNELRPARLMKPTYPAAIEQMGHSGATYFEHVNFVNNILGEKTTTATVEEGFWSVVVGTAAQESIASGQPVYIDQMLAAHGIEA